MIAFRKKYFGLSSLWQKCFLGPKRQLAPIRIHNLQVHMLNDSIITTGW
jgi:hypothetical protein